MGTTRAGRSAARLPAQVRKITPYQRLKDAIRSGELRPGQQLVESVLAEWCEVSRTPIREALSKLQHDGLVERSERGLVVRERSPEEILDIYETRIALEGTAARLAAERRTSHDLILLRRALVRLAAVDTADVDAMVSANRHLHLAVWRASHNVSLIDLLERLDLHLARYPATTLSTPGRWTTANEQHTAVVDAIEAREGERAEQIATTHFAEARDIRLRLYDTEDIDP
jgi:DNA-binding GntR family transcriptional regulator